MGIVVRVYLKKQTEHSNLRFSLSLRGGRRDNLHKNGTPNGAFSISPAFGEFAMTGYSE